MTIDILGTKYKIKYQTEEENSKLIGANAIFEAFSKELIIDKDNMAPAIRKHDNLSGFNKKVMRHEIIHAFLFEGGLSNYHGDETLTDGLAILLPKMFKVMSKLKVLE